MLNCHKVKRLAALWFFGLMASAASTVWAQEARDDNKKPAPTLSISGYADAYFA